MQLSFATLWLEVSNENEHMVLHFLWSLIFIIFSWRNWLILKYKFIGKWTRNCVEWMQLKRLKILKHKRILKGYIKAAFMYFKGHLEKEYINRYINKSFQHSKVYKPYPYILTHLIIWTTLWGSNGYHLILQKRKLKCSHLSSYPGNNCWK